MAFYRGADSGYVNKTELLLGGKWTRTSIKRLLDPPDKTIRTQNLHRPECWYLKERVAAVEAAGKTRYRAKPRLTIARAERLGEEFYLEPRPGEAFCGFCRELFEYEPKIRGRRRRYCSDECRREFWRQRKMRIRNEKRLKTH